MLPLAHLAQPAPAAFDRITDVVAYVLAHPGFELVEARTRNFHPSVQLARVGEAVKLRAALLGDTITRDGILLWRQNQRPVPAHVFTDAGLPCPAFQAAADRAHTDATVAAYRAAQPAEPTAEERAEARAAHGPGVDLVDVLTGRRFTT